MEEVLWCLVCIETIVLIICFLVILYLNRKIKAEIFRKMIAKLDDFVLFLSALILLVSMVLDFFNVTEGTATLMLNIFTTLVFSWLLTKKSSEMEFKKQQERLAKLSHRHLCGVEASILSLGQSIKDYDGYDDNEFLQGLSGRIEDVQNGIQSNEADWEDMLSEEYKKELKKNQTLIETQKTEELNQEMKERIRNISFKFYNMPDVEETIDSMDEDLEAAEVGDEEIAVTVVDDDNDK